MNIKNIFPRQITLLVCLSVLLCLLRVVIFHSWYFIYLLWNIFLAIMPFLVSSILLYFATKSNRPHKIFFIIGGVLWLLLLPNAPYIVTDMIHIGHNRSVPVLYDTFLLFSSAWAGMMLGLYSISHIEKILRMKYRKIDTRVMIGLIIFVTSFGMYLGRFLRFNSWDVFSSPIIFFGNIWSIFTNPSTSTDIYLFVSISFIFLYLSYYAWKEGR